VESAVSRWGEFAMEAGVPEGTVGIVASELNGWSRAG
jgi:hypothetical protein